MKTSIKSHNSAKNLIPKSINNVSGIFLDIPASCDLRCLFCSGPLRKNGIKSSEWELENIISGIRDAYPLLKEKQLFIGGTEPLNYKNIVCVLRYAKKIGFKYINIATSSMALMDKQFVKTLVVSGVNRFELPIYGYDSGSHDYIVRVKGSFTKLMKSIENLKRYTGVDILLHTLLLKQNYMFFHEIDKFVNNVLKVFPLRVHSVGPRSNNLQDYALVCPTCTEVNRAIKKHNLKDEFLDFPLCVLPRAYLKMLFQREYHQCLKFTPSRISRLIKISRGGIFLQDDNCKDSVRRRIKPSKCKKCKVNNFCGGIYSLYIDLYGHKELAPVISLDKISGNGR